MSEIEDEINSLLPTIKKQDIFSIEPGSIWDKISERFNLLPESQQEAVQAKIAKKIDEYVLNEAHYNFNVPTVPPSLLKKFKIERVISNDIEGSIGTFRTSLPKIIYPVKYSVSTSNLSKKLKLLSKAGKKELHFIDSKAIGCLLENIDRLYNEVCLVEANKKEIKNDIV